MKIEAMFSDALKNPVRHIAGNWMCDFWDAYDDASVPDDYNLVDNFPVLIGAASMIGAMLASAAAMTTAHEDSDPVEFDPTDVLTAISMEMRRAFDVQMEIINSGSE